ncbi:unnamed protein product (macronuclear) [Paramecium tetraurelia]|uniref:Cyclic nucleotide-binding domain-containing protein n=1 Tax=Paramecium tetraurelia TaxID=5888 RepID=A0ED67_PARTE|nr:uncharacterized protein GSPATT00004103001 [Paramecium tetraurelia]CAK93234.1 unnamed protein product [Paramecium tetraurelia]|eukprot:XP_001460631.1 hypothetical protein (macronuclear) [Paramecium tetraurelia strain d4-2]
MKGYCFQPSSKEILENLQTNYQSPHLELVSTTHRIMAMSTYQRPKTIKRNTTISIFTQQNESESTRKSQRWIFLLKKYVTLVRISISFINSLKEYQKKQKIERLDSKQWKKESILPFYPDDFFIKKWRIFIEILTFSSVILYPIYISFEVNHVIDLVVIAFDILFLIDIVLNFLTGYIDECNNLIIDFNSIFKHYLKTWLLFDVLSVFPAINYEKEWFKKFKMIRVLKYFLNNKEVTYKGQENYIQFIESLNPEQEFILKSGTKYLLNVMITTCLLIHIFGCWQHFFDSGDYITNIYWSSQTITTVGYGDIKANYEFAVFWMIVGVAFYSFTIGDFALMMSKSKVNEDQDLLFLIEQLGHTQNFPEKLKHKFQLFVKNNLYHNQFWLVEYKTMAKELPHNLRLYLTLSTMLDVCKQIPLFLYDINYTSLLLLNIRYLIVEEGFVLYREGQSSSEIFFLLQGDIRIMTKDKTILLNILEGTIFGEFEAIEEKLRGTYCVAQKKSICLVIPYRILRRVMSQSQILDFEIRQLHLRRRRLIINNFIEERRRKNAYKRQEVRFYTQSFIQMTKEEYILNKKTIQILSVEEYNKQLLNKIIGQKLQRLSLFLVKFKRSVQRVIEMNHQLDETIPEQWRELSNYQLIKRVFPKEYLSQKFQQISLSRKSSSVHSSGSKLSKMKYSTYSQQYFFQKLPEIRLKHIVLQHIRLTKNKFVPLQQIVNKYSEDPEQLNLKKKENVERSVWTKKFTKISQTVILRIDQIQDSGDKCHDIMQSIIKIEKLWLKGSMYKFEWFQNQHGKQKEFLI